MKTYNHLYENFCSWKNLNLAFEKARKGKSNKVYVQHFAKNLNQELENLKYEFESFTYKPRSLTRFIVRDPKTRTIHASAFRDRVAYHALVNIIGPIFERIFIHDSYASRVNKGTHNAITRFDKFKRKVTNNGQLVNNGFSNNVIGYALKADIKHYFETVDHEVLINIIKKKVRDEKIIWVIRQILDNYDTEIQGKGMPLGNHTSQFFANVYLNELDYYIKHQLRQKYYIRYVDDFIILNKEKEILQECHQKINDYLIKNLKLEMHPNKSKVIPLRNGITLLGYRAFYHYKLLRKSNKKKFERNFNENLNLHEKGLLTSEKIKADLLGWFGYAKWANTYKFRKIIIKRINKIESKQENGHQTFKNT